VTDTSIRSVESFVVETPRKPFVFVTVETADGAVGTGEAAPNYAAGGVVDAIGRMESAVVGMDPGDPERIRRACVHPAIGRMNNVVESSAASAIDIACWDLKGKRAGAPLVELLGGAVTDTPLPAYANGWWQGLDDRDPDAFADAAEAVADDGYAALKFDPFGEWPATPGRDDIETALDRVRAVGEAVGPGVEVFVDGHKTFTPGVALEVAERLAACDVGFFEEPTPPTVGALRQVASRSPVPIATGESLLSHRAFADPFAETDLAVCQPDPVRAGGVTEIRRISAAAATHGVTFSPHNACGPVSTAACAHLSAAAPTFGTQELFEGYGTPEWVADLYAGSVTVENGRLHVPEGHGLGIELDRDAVRERSADE
jgi:galactonate dehydratase